MQSEQSTGNLPVRYLFQYPQDVNKFQCLLHTFLACWHDEILLWLAANFQFVIFNMDTGFLTIKYILVSLNYVDLGDVDKRCIYNACNVTCFVVAYIKDILRCFCAFKDEGDPR